MSLRDALLAKGVVSKKQVRDAERALKEERKQKQARKARKSKRRAEQEAAEAAEIEARRLQAERDRAEAAHARAAHEHVHRVRDIIRSQTMGARGPVPFWHRVGTTNRIARLHVSPAAARDLRLGRLAIAAYEEPPDTWHHALVRAEAAEKLDAIAPEALVHWVRDGGALRDPAEAPLDRDWDPSLTPHRVRG